MSAKRRRIREADLVSLPPEVVEVVRKMDRLIIVTEVEEGSILEEILLDDLLGTQGYLAGNTSYQFDTILRKTEDLLPLTEVQILPEAVRIIGEYSIPKKQTTCFIVSGSFSEIEQIRKLTKIGVA